MRRVLITVLAIVIAVALPLEAAEANPTKKQRELIVELLKLTGGEKTTTAVMNAMLAQTEKKFTAQAEAEGNSPKELEELKELFALFKEEFGRVDISAVMAESSIQIYAKHYTERELADLVAFYRTPTGRKSVELIPEIVRESAESGAQNVVPLVDEALSRAMERQDEKKRPWKRTMSDIRTLATAIETYSIDRLDTEGYPLADYESLKGLLVPDFIKTMPAKDAWGSPYAYVVSPDGQHYRIVSAGSDLKFERDSLRVADDGKPRKEIQSERLESDIIYEDGLFVQFPDLKKIR